MARRPASRSRPDIVPTTDAELSEALLKYSEEQALLDAPAERVKRRHEAAGNERYAARTDFIEPKSCDPFGYERIIGESDLSSINYLDRGRRAAAAVCRIRVPGGGGGEWYGTGFLAGPRLLVTNHHVLGNRSEAGQAVVEFGYEHDIDGVLQAATEFKLVPHEIFFTDPDLDVTFVSVAPYSDNNIPTDRYGWLALLPLTGKAIDREWVTIIQHPNGGPKQISMRSSSIVELDPKDVPKNINLEHFIHYLTDTEPGSSGSPVVNDQWQVVALHHKAVPAPKSKTDKESEPLWIANEGVRISAIYKMLERNRLEDKHARRTLERLENGLGLPPPSRIARSAREDIYEHDAEAFKATRWKKSARIGYDPRFLSVRVDLGPIYTKLQKRQKTAPLLDGSGDELRYNRFSVIVHRERKFALLTAVNIHGDKLLPSGARKDAWRRDPRMDAVYQPANNFYATSQGHDKVQFSRGHLVRRLDPCWGEDEREAKLGEEDTFHFANAAPQVQKFNDLDWGNLEDYVLDRAQTTEKRMTVFTGPIFRKDDPYYGRDRKGGPWQIPISYWKIAVLEKRRGKSGDNEIAAAAFIIGQTQYVAALYESKVFAGLRPYRLEDLRSSGIQTTIATIEQETDLDFSSLRKFDSHGSLEATRQTRWIKRLDDILI